MTFTYAAGASAKDDVRLLIGDVDPAAYDDLRLEDEDIARILTLEGDNLRRAAAVAAEVLAAKFARKAEGSQGPDRVQPSNRAQELRATANRLRASAAAAATPVAGGLTLSGKRAAEQDTDRVVPPFRKGMLDHPHGTSS